MKLTDVINALNGKHNGSWFNIKYQSAPTVKSAFKKSGINVVKFSENLVRTGIAYNNIASVIEKKSADGNVASQKTENNNEWVVPNKVLFNSKTQKYSARFGFCNGHKSRTTFKAYDKNGNEIPFDKNYIIDSYWNNHNTDKTVMNINIENIIEIG